jgi:hypothetical protein
MTRQVPTKLISTNTGISVEILVFFTKNDVLQLKI